MFKFISLYFRCKCNGHASRCVLSTGQNLEDHLVCQCEHHTKGPDCGECDDFYNDQPWSRATLSEAHDCQRKYCICLWICMISHLNALGFIYFLILWWLYQWFPHWDLRQDGRHFTDNTFKCIILNENVPISIQILLNFVLKGPIKNPSLSQILAWRRSGNKPLS